MRVVRAPSLLAIALWLLGSAARAQDLPAPVSPAHVAIVDGAASLTRDNERDEVTSGSPLVPGDRLRTDRGRVELFFPDGSALDLDEFTSFELLSATHFRVTEGRLLIAVPGAARPSEAVHFVIDTPSGSAETYGPGDYRLSLLTSPSGLQTELAVIRGSAALINDRGTMPLRSAERSLAWDGSAPSLPQTFNSARFDAFDRWAGALREDRLSGLSSQYLPPDVRMYGGALDRNGSWQYDAPYGNVWYPNVEADWRPYSDGYWTPVPSYGWTWIGSGSWSWPTHHYGRWGYERSRWFWIPDERWAPAWVSWGSAPGYVSWSPLGFDDRPLFGAAAAYRSNGVGWTVVARDHFDGPRRNVRQSAVPARGLPPNTPFVTQSVAPLPLSRTASRRFTVAPSPNAPRVPPGPGVGGRRSADTSTGGRDRSRVSPPRDAEPAGAPRAERRANERSSSLSSVPPGAARAETPQPSAPRAVPRGGWPGAVGPAATTIYSTPPRRPESESQPGAATAQGRYPPARAAAPELAPRPQAPSAPTHPDSPDLWRPARRSAPRQPDTARVPPPTPLPAPQQTEPAGPQAPREETARRESARAASGSPAPEEGRRSSAGRAVPRNERARGDGSTGQSQQESAPSGRAERPGRVSRRSR